MNTSLNLESVVDRKESLGAEDIAFLKKRMKKQLRSWAFFAIAGGLILSIWQPLTLQYIFLVTGGWVVVSVYIWLGFTRTIDRGIKFVTRGEITARFVRSEEGSRNKSSDGDFVLQINGKLIAVNNVLYKIYFKRDIAEFHYLDSGLILQHKLLKRER